MIRFWDQNLKMALSGLIFTIFSNFHDLESEHVMLMKFGDGIPHPVTLSWSSNVSLWKVRLEIFFRSPLTKAQSHAMKINFTINITHGIQVVLHFRLKKLTIECIHVKLSSSIRYYIYRYKNVPSRNPLASQVPILWLFSYLWHFGKSAGVYELLNKHTMDIEQCNISKVILK